MEQQSPEWFAAREGRVTASNAGAIIGADPYRGPDDVLRRMVRDYHGAESEFTGNVATEHGNMHEPGARAELEMELGILIDAEGFVVHPDHEWLGASPDGSTNNCKTLIEIKCPYGQRDKNPPVFKSIDDQPHYYAQIQVQLYCTGAHECIFYQWAPHGTKTEWVYPDQDWLDNHIPELERFYHLYLNERDNKEHLEPKRKIVDTLEASKLLAEYDEVCDQADFIDQRKKEIIASLVKMAKERDAEICGRKLTKVIRQGSVAYAKVVKKFCPDVDLEPYRGKASESWRLS